MNQPNDFSQATTLTLVETPFMFSLAEELNDIEDYEGLIPGQSYIGTHAYYNKRTGCLSIRLFDSSDYVILHHSYITVNPCMSPN